MKAFFDTNVSVAALAARGLCVDLFAHVLLQHDLVRGEVVVTELRTTLRTKLKLPKKTIDEIEAQLRDGIVVKTPAEPINLRKRARSGSWEVVSTRAVLHCLT